MDDDLVQVVQAHLLQGPVDGAGGVLVSFQLRRHLAGHKQRLPGRAAGADALAHASLVAVGLGGVDEPVAQLDRLPDGLRRLAVVNELGAKAQLWNLDTVCQGVSLVQDHGKFLLYRLTA